MGDVLDRAYAARTRGEVEAALRDIQRLFEDVPVAEVPDRYPEELAAAEMLTAKLALLPPEGVILP